VSPANPTGARLKRDELAVPVELCAKHDLALIGDEVFAAFEEEPVDDLVAEDGQEDAPVEAVPVAKAPRKTAAKKTVKKTTKKSEDV